MRLEVEFELVKGKTREKSTSNIRKGRESISAFKEELRSMTFEPFYGENIKSIVTRITSKIQSLAEDYGYDIEFPKKAEMEIDGNIYYFNYTLKVKTRTSTKKIILQVQYIMYEEENWVGMITDVK
ncbi:MAG: hypothetical protein ASUL_03569 [Candidatus Aramenus sulfurataquae]|jgi:hypothetical protein|uniref:Uncharacterized protein n=1 Tax=Candidatus Aramenus sulfurataquae TaxID=1326980 RepID=W7L792_9CREN|nr:MAG: hypothetical protein ASUL_03569 [Candidatus Aramenus sulfurataquae]